MQCRCRIAVSALILGAVLAACSASSPAPPPPVAVNVIKMVPQPAEITQDFVGQTEAVNTVEIRPRVGGLLDRQAAVEGSKVKQGQLLFVIDPQPYIAALAQAKAGLAQAEAALDQSKRDLARIQPLSAIDAVSQQELDAAVAKNEANLASVSAAQAAVKTATLNLGYTNITSPIDGVMGSAQLRLGGLATADTTLLTTVYQLDRLFVNFSVSEQDLLAFQRRIGRAPDENRPTTTARIFLADGSEYPERPTLNFVGAAVDPNTGTLAVRLIVSNPNGLLHAGQFARVQLVAQRIPDALLVPQRAVQELQGKNYLWIVDGDDKAEQRDVKMGPRIGENWLVQSGLRPGDVVVVDGVQHLKPGVPVRVLPPESAPQPARAPAGTTKSRGGS